MKKIVQKTPLKGVRELEARRRWYLVDARDLVLGRLATQVASQLRGKNKSDFSPHLDGGDFVVVINASKISFTGKKGIQKVYYSHSGYPGGLKSEALGKLLARKPERALVYAVRGMLPKGRLGARIFRRLKVYAGDRHPHGVNKPEILKIETK